MAIAETKTRMSLVIDKNDKAQLEEIATQQERSVNYCICKAIKQYIKENTKETK